MKRTVRRRDYPGSDLGPRGCESSNTDNKCPLWHSDGLRIDAYFLGEGSVIVKRRGEKTSAPNRQRMKFWI